MASALNHCTGGDIYIGVVGPVRSSKSTFIKRFMEQLVLPAIGPAAAQVSARDELHSSRLRAVPSMTTEPKLSRKQPWPCSWRAAAGCRVRPHRLCGLHHGGGP